jgi:NADH:ubiquinone oxidoreductase subunit 5 (subunit L)/multisubunit Na+/H+ antiporter MnhA subunit
MIIAQAWEVSKPLFWVGVVTATLTAFYMFRIYFKTFEGKYRGHAHPHEQPWSVTVPLMVLAVPSIALGFFGSPFKDFSVLRYLDGHFHSHMQAGQSAMDFFLYELNQPFGYLPFLAFVVGVTVSYLVYVSGMGLNKFCREKLSILFNGSLNKWYIDEIYNAIVAAFMAFFRVTWGFIDKFIIEGIFINGFAWRGTEFTGEILKLTQSGRVQAYILTMIAAVGIAVAVLVFAA